MVRLPPTATVSTFIGEVKGATAFHVNRNLAPKMKLHWQEGYGVLTVRKDELEKVARYIDQQEEHHGKGRLSALLETMEGDEDDWPEGKNKPLKGAELPWD